MSISRYGKSWPLIIKTGKRICSFFLPVVFILLLTGCVESNEKTVHNLSADKKVIDIINHPTFEGFGRFLFPTERGLPRIEMRLDEIGSLLPYHSNVKIDAVMEVIAYMMDEAESGKTIFYDIYTDEEKRSDPTKENAGLFFFRGEPNAPFAVICAGGGFSYVGSIHESFPLALELSKKGYNAFAIQYRTGGASIACEDLAAAISFIFANSEELEVNTQNYSLWGGSAGARMVAYLGSYGPAAYGGDNLPRAGTVVMLYTGHSDYTTCIPGFCNENAENQHKHRILASLYNECVTMLHHFVVRPRELILQGFT